MSNPFRKSLIGVVLIVAGGGLLLLLFNLFSLTRVFSGKEAFAGSAPEAMKDRQVRLLNVATGRYDTLLLQGKTLLSFWQEGCGRCRETMPSLERMARSRQDLQLCFLSFEDPVKQRKFIDETGFRLPFYHVEDTSFFSRPSLYPAHLLLRNDTLLSTLYSYPDWTSASAVGMLDSIYNHR